MFSLKVVKMAVLSAFVASGCQSLGGTVNFVHKTGSTLAQRQNAMDACQVSALQQVPPAYKTRTIGGYGGGFCNGWTCYGSGGFYPDTISYDPNDALRARQFNKCLASKGYTIMARPSCTTRTEADAYRSAKRQASASRIDCVAGEPLLQSRWVRQR
ncbi:hypothetical protein [Roseibium sp. RKSG952]|uniref:hypothetical protein n=1 Tax=Roseibium sp. RKSG952 TaxID=2529384 RepID=UPI0012BCA372|nr:hypothetical protein [Roseibium sp. RKSG952]MTH98895.1 hypothetical protein [Roseibium sp. RKSG952]